MALNIITPHPLKSRPVIALQGMNNNGQNGPKHYRYYDFEKDLSRMNNHNAYQILIKFFK